MTCQDQWSCQGTTLQSLDNMQALKLSVIGAFEVWASIHYYGLKPFNSSIGPGKLVKADALGNLTPNS